MGKRELLVMCSFVALGLGTTGCPADEGEESESCSGAVDVQIYNFDGESHTVAASIEGGACSLSVDLAAMSGTPTYVFSRDLSAGDLILYDGENQSILCTVHQNGVDTTYVRARVEPGGSISCECGFQEYHITVPTSDCPRLE